jgi:hypothetical protein
MEVAWKGKAEGQRKQRIRHLIELENPNLQGMDTGEQDLEAREFTGFCLQIMDKVETAIIEAPLLLRLNSDRPISWIAEIGLPRQAVHLLEWTPERSDILDGALYLISDLLSLGSIEIYNQMITERVVFRSNDATLCDVIAVLACESSEIMSVTRQEAILRIIAMVHSFAPELTEKVLSFICASLHSSENQILETASESVVYMIRCCPRMPIAKNLAQELSFDPENPTISQYCFEALNSLISAGDTDCFDFNQIMSLAQSDGQLAVNALTVLASASHISTTIAKKCAERAPDFRILLSKGQIKPRYICWLIQNVVGKGSELCYCFMECIPVLMGEAYDKADTICKVEMVKAIAEILLYSKKMIDDVEILEFLAEALLLQEDGSDMRSVVMDLLRTVGYQSETYLNALYLMQDDEDCGQLAMWMIDEMESRFMQ